MRAFVCAALIGVSVAGCGSTGAELLRRNPLTSLFNATRSEPTEAAFERREVVDKRARVTTSAAGRIRASPGAVELPARSPGERKRTALRGREAVPKKPAVRATPTDCDADARRMTSRLQRQNDQLKAEGIGLCKSAKIFKATMAEVAAMWKGCRQLDPTGNSLRSAREGVKHAEAMIKVSCGKAK